MKTKELTAVKMYFFEEVLHQYSFKLLIKNVICSPT